MPQQTDRQAVYRSILVPVDLEEPGSWSKALPVAVSLAQAYGARLTLGSVITDATARREAQWFVGAYRELVGVVQARLHALARGGGFSEPAILVGRGSVGGGILDMARDAGADLIVLASHRPGVKDYLIGANAVHVVRHAPCSVLVVRE